MIKTYKSNTHISINVVLPSKKNLHVSFVPLSNGSSMFTTNDKEVQTAIEQHYQFGKLFKLQAMQGQSVSPKRSKEKAEKKVSTEPDNAETGENNEEVIKNGTETENETGLKKVKVSDLASAKDYLADTFGISRTVLRSKKAIEEQATAQGIEFEGLS